MTRNGQPTWFAVFIHWLLGIMAGALSTVLLLGISNVFVFVLAIVTVVASIGVVIMDRK